MIKISAIIVVSFLFACNNAKKDNERTTNDATNTQTTTDQISAPAAPAPGSAMVNYTADGVAISHSASILVSKDKDNLKPGVPFICILTSNSAGNNNETLSLNFLLDTKPGTYPIVGMSFMRGNTPNDEMYGALLGGNPKITSHNVTITECRNLGDNGLGGHKWSISGNWEEVTIDATPIMLLDKEKKHPAAVKVKGSFSNLTFDDNWEEVLEKTMDKMKK